MLVKLTPAEKKSFFFQSQEMDHQDSNELCNKDNKKTAAETTFGNFTVINSLQNIILFFIAWLLITEKGRKNEFFDENN